MASESSLPAELPTDLAAVPEAERFRETHGWAPSAWGLGCLCLAWLTLFRPAPLASVEAALLAVALLLAAVLFLVDLRRRRRPRVLHRPGAGPLLGIYREGRLQRTVEVARCTRFQRRALHTWGPLVLLALGMVACVLLLKEGLGGVTLGERLLPLWVLGFCLALFTSLLKTRLRCEEALFPRAHTSGTESILLSRSAVKRLLDPAP